MSEPDTNVMRATYATAATYRQSPDPGRAAEFDRWLAGVKADAWDEGHADGRHNEHEFREGRQITNPYRQEAER